MLTSVPRNEAEDCARAGRQGPTRSGVRSALAQHGHPCGVFLADPGAERECFVAEMECFAAAAAGDVSWLSSADSCRPLENLTKLGR